MATTGQTRNVTESVPDRSNSGPGIAHLTVIPTNFDPDAPGKNRDSPTHS